MTGGRACSCVTCGDEAIPMRTVRLDVERELALCESGDGQRHTVEIGLLDGSAVGDTLLVHAGVAIVRLPDEDTAA